jgi:hypothetical protein
MWCAADTVPYFPLGSTANDYRQGGEEREHDVMCRNVTPTHNLFSLKPAIPEI